MTDNDARSLKNKPRLYPNSFLKKTQEAWDQMGSTFKQEIKLRLT